MDALLYSQIQDLLVAILERFLFILDTPLNQLKKYLETGRVFFIEMLHNTISFCNYTFLNFFHGSHERSVTTLYCVDKCLTVIK